MTVVDSQVLIPPRFLRSGVIDIGSNSIRLVVFDGGSRAPFPVFNEKLLCGLGRTLPETGRLNPEGVIHALDSLERFALLAAGMQVDPLMVVATAAVREASDGPAFVAEVERRTGLTVQVISGEEEARLSALGVLSGTPGAEGLTGDLGGGSLELVTLSDGALGERATLPLGPFRLQGQGLSSKPGALAKRIDQILDTLPWLAAGRGQVFYPVGGNWRALAKLHLEHIQHPLHIIHHYQVPAPALRDFAGLIARQSRSSLDKISAGSRRRNDTLPLAALVMERVLRRIEPAMVVFSAYGLREGLLFSHLGADALREDPLLAGCRELAARLGRFGIAAALVSWTQDLFNSETAEEGRLRQAACLLSDLGWVEHPDYRAEHAALRILRLPLVGIDHPGRAFLALSVYLRYGGRLEDPAVATARALLPAAGVQRAQVLGLTLRLAHTLAGGTPTLLAASRLRQERNRLILGLPPAHAHLMGDTPLRRLETLARLLDRVAVVTHSAGI